MQEQTVLAHLLSQLWFRFGFVAILGFMTGLELHGFLQDRKEEHSGYGQDSAKPPVRFGTSRTYTFIAILGYVCTVLDSSLHLYLMVLAGLIILLAIFFYHKLQIRQSSALQPLVALVVYSYGPTVTFQPAWFLVLLFVSVVFTLNARPLAHHILEMVDRREMLTLAKFLFISGVIIPLLPRSPVSAYIPASPFKIGIAVLVISSISYIGYILKKYFLKRQGYLVAGILGGLYSSTATTLVLARKTRGAVVSAAGLNAGIVAASGVMYIRLLLLVAFLNPAILPHIIIPLVVLSGISLAAAWGKGLRNGSDEEQEAEMGRSNPLELGVALVFAILFVVMIAITRQVIIHFGKSGLDILSFAVGFTDIDPFILSLLNGPYQGVSTVQVTGAILIAAGSNNILKAGYAAVFGNRKLTRDAILFLIMLGTASLVWGFYMAKGLF